MGSPLGKLVVFNNAPHLNEAFHLTVADALRQFAPDYIAKHRKRMPPHHHKVLRLILRCKTGELGSVAFRCQSCWAFHWMGRSCGNRHCPNCQKDKTQQWLAKQTAKLLPVQHFVVTFTVPKELRPMLRAHPEVGYEAIFRAGSETIRTLLAEPKNLGSKKLGFFGVLHTWGRDLKDFHPHVHFVVPGGGVSEDGTRWLQVKPDRLFHPDPAKRLYKSLFVEEIRKAGLYDKIPYGVLKFDWVVNLKPVGNGEAVLKYLAPYVYRIAISDNRIESVDDSHVHYRVKPSGESVYQSRRLSGESFVRCFTQHILPPGFTKIRYYGFLSPNCKLQLADARSLVFLWLGWTFCLNQILPTPSLSKRKLPECPRCQGEMSLFGITHSDGQWLWRALVISRGPPKATSPPRVSKRNPT